MNTPQHRRARSLDKQFPGCLGKMVNLFDLSAGLTSNKLLTDHPHPNGLTLSRSFSDISMTPSSPSKNQVEVKRTVSHMRRCSSGQKSLGTPMKALIAEELSKDVEIKPVRSNVIAKLMGLETIPQKQPQSRAAGHTPMDRAAKFWDKDCLFLNKEVQNELLKFHEYKDCADLFGMLKQPNNLNTVREQPAQKVKRSRSKQEKKMDIVRQKFMDAKRLVTDKKLRHSWEFKEALEVLSSNRELFLRFLQEPDSLFSGKLFELQSLPHETKRITILRPSKMVDVENFSMQMEQNDKLIKHMPSVAEPDQSDLDVSEHVYDRVNENCKDRPPQPTRIVLLKPSTWKNDKMKNLSSPCFEDSKCEKLESSDVTGEIPGPVKQNLPTIRMDETLLSSVYSNGYASDDSSFYKSASEVIGNLSDFEVMSTPRHSWDFLNKVGSPHSMPSFSRASYSPESSVCREAKKRLSERWALMASHQKSQESRLIRNSGTLGEMLALLDTKKSVGPEEGVSSEDQQLIGSTSWSVADSNKEEAPVEPPKFLVRSKSMPVSSSSYSNTLVAQGEDPETGKSNAPKEMVKKGSVNSSFKGRVSSLFSFRNRRSNKEKSSKSSHKNGSQSTSVDSPSDSSDEPTKNGDDDTSELVNDNFLGACSSPGHNPPHPEDPDVQQGRGTFTHEVELSTPMLDSKGNRDHPSPISVLDQSFEEDDNLTSESPGVQTPVLPLRFNLIDKSPPIGSIARTLSWDDSINEATVPYLLKSPNVSPVMEEELDWLAFVQTLISEAGFDGQLSLDSLISRWYSPESPLDPSLREKFANELLMPQAKCRQRSERKLAFDCVNIALVKITRRCGSSWSSLDRSYVEARNGSEQSTSSMIGEHVWAQMKEWFSDEVWCKSKDDGDSSLVLEKVVRNEVVGRGWIENLGMEMHWVGKDIEVKLLGELVDEAVKDLTGRL